MLQISLEDTIVGISSPPGIGAIAIIRSSGKNVFKIIQDIFYTKKNKPFSADKLQHKKMYYGLIVNKGNIIDEVMLCTFHQPHSYTGEDMAEIYCHGSTYIQQKIVQLFIDCGARLANPGEFTIRAYLNGKINLNEAEAINDLIHSESESAHTLAIQQLRGGYKNLIEELRTNILNYASLLELELDFSEEDVEFANRKHLTELLSNTIRQIDELLNSFQMGNVIKTGVPVVIIGKPNAGKSTLLNTLLNEEKAIVSEIPGTTRDLIEDKLIINGIMFRIIDTAGIRESKDEIEKIGIDRTKQSIEKAMIIILLQDITQFNKNELHQNIQLIQQYNKNATVLKVFNKCDKITNIPDNDNEKIYISAKEKININILKQKLSDIVIQKGYHPHQPMVSNIRHYNELKHAKKYLEKSLNDLKENISTELISEDLKFAIQHLSNITGRISSEDVLSNIFSKFCIGK